MKKVTLILLAAAVAFLSACDNSTKVKSEEAQEVTQTESTEAKTFSKVQAESYLTWRGTHLGGLQPRFGKVFLKSAEAKVLNKELSNAKIVFDMTNFTVENFEDDEEKTKKLTGHLQSDDFFKVATFPTSTFELTKVEKAEGDYNTRITGNLTILGVTKSISFNANVTTTDSQVSVKSEKFTIDRTEWGLKYNVDGTEGVPTDYLIDNGVEFQVNVTLDAA